jgi:putative colanic acid biosynthesis UDP-glucose lipid carrier transferase
MESRAVLLGVLRAADLVAVAVAGILGYAGWHASLAVPTQYWVLIAAGCAAAGNWMQLLRVYDFASLRRPAANFGPVAWGWTATLLTIIAIIYFARLGDTVSRAWMLIWSAGGLAGLALVRLTAWHAIAHPRRMGKLMMNVAVVGAKGAAGRVAARLMENDGDDLRIVGIFNPVPVQAAGSIGRDLPGLDDLVELAHFSTIDEIVVALPCDGEPQLGSMLRKLRNVPVDVKLCPDLSGVARETDPAMMIRPPMVRIFKRPCAGWGVMVKRTMDLAISTVLLLLLSPLAAAIALAIKLDSPGPVLFRQQRLGFNGDPFTVYKFRSMHHERQPKASVVQARRNDPRVTRIGRLLRRTSLDELPQLLNVLLGDMSLVGPRPHAIVHDVKYAALIDGYLARHRVKPGITGWAQVNGYRGETDTLEKMQRRIAHDLHYIDRWSPLLDLRILIRTLFVVLSRNAY